MTFAGVSGFWANLFILGGIGVALAALTYRYVERPALERKYRGTRAIETNAAAEAIGTGSG
jgi:peptidoglycan/LPS O-acetylase OafA/YrhL